MFGSFLAALTASALAAVGAAGAIAPRLLAKGYGIVPDDESGLAWTRAAALRDAACAGMLVSVLAYRSRPALRATILWLMAIALGDFAVVASRRGVRAAPNLCVHASGVVLLASVWVVLRAEDGDELGR